MDDLTARLFAEKRRRPSCQEIAIFNASLWQINQDLERFLAHATGRRAPAGTFPQGRPAPANIDETPKVANDLREMATLRRQA